MESRVSRWSDAPPTSQMPASITQNADNGEKRPPSAAPEPLFKKSRTDLAQTQRESASGFATPPAPAPIGGSGYGASPADRGFGASSAHGGDRGGYGGFAPGSARGSGTGALFFKTKLCTKFKLGACTFNERCHFAHGVEELKKAPAGWEEMTKPGGGGAASFNMAPSYRSSEAPRRTNKPCRFYLEGHCPYGERCTFSHGTEDMQREAVPSMESVPAASAPGRPSYKTRMCSRWERGELCIYGDKCHFAHGQAEMRSYPGGSNYTSSGGTATSAYSDYGVANQPTMAAPYGAPATYGSNSAPPPATSANLNPYPVPGANVSAYGAQPDGTNGYSTNYPYWNQENKWDVGNQDLAAPTKTIPTQGYGPPPNQASWMPNYSMDGGYPKVNNAGPYINQDMSQQQLPQALQQPQPQPQPQQPQQQQQNVAYYGGVAPYQDPSQAVNPPFIQDATQNGDGSAYYSSNYASQQGYVGNLQQMYAGNQQ